MIQQYTINKMTESRDLIHTNIKSNNIANYVMCLVVNSVNHYSINIS